MIDDSDPRRDALHEFLQSQGPPKDDEEELAEGSVLTGWVLISEWMDPDGERWIVRGWASSKTKWEADGMAHAFLRPDYWGDGNEG